MKKNVIAFITTLLMSGFSFADHHEGHEGHGHGHKKKKIHVHGAIDLNYTYNFNKVDGLNADNFQHADQTAGIVNLNFGGSMNSLDWFIDLAFAGQNRLRLIGGPSSADLVAQAYLTKHINENLSFTAGRMFSNVGFEGVYNKDNWNYSKSYAFQLTGPWVNEGVALKYATNNGFGFGAFVYDGNETLANPISLTNQTDLAYSAQLSYGTEMFGIVYNFFHDEDGVEGYHNLNISADLSPSASVAVSAVRSDRKDTNEEYFGVAAYAKFALYRNAYIAPRLEFLKRDVATEDLKSATLTYGYNCEDAGDWRLEGRYDMADGNFANSKGTIKDNQFSMAIAWMHGF